MSTDLRPEEQAAAAPAAEAAPAAAGPSLVDEILKAGRVRPAEQPRLTDALATFVDQVLDGKMKVLPDTEAMISAQIAEIDELLSAQLNAILHHEEFQKLESSWRGLRYLVYESETSPRLKIRVLNTSRRELLRDLERAPEFTESALYKLIYTNEYNQPGADPYAALVGDFEFNCASAEDMDLLSRVTEVAAAAHAPFLSAASPESFGVEDFTELSRFRSLAEIFDHKRDPRYIKWNSFRESEDSRYAGLCLPHVLMRLPYGTGEGCKRVDGFRYEEDVDGTDHGKYLWGNAAYALATRLTDAFARYSWCQTIRGRENGGQVSGLPVHTFRTDEGYDAKCPTEVAIGDSREKELADLGFISLCHYKNTDYSVFFSAQSCQKPKTYRGATGDQATASARLSTNLPYVFMVSRFAHYLKVMMRDKVGSFMTRENCERFLNDWIKTYVCLTDDASPEIKAQLPLREARIDVIDDPRRPGCYRAISYLKPHYMLEELTAELRLVSELPTPGQQ